jgi:hypothetical protein
MAGDDKIDKRTLELQRLNEQGAATAKKPSWAGKKWKAYRKGGTVSVGPPTVGPGTTAGGRDYGK